MAMPRLFCRLRFLNKTDFFVVSKPPAFLTSVTISKIVCVQKHYRTNFSTCLVLYKSEKDKLSQPELTKSTSSSKTTNVAKKEKKPSGSESSSSSSSSSDSDSDSDDEETYFDSPTLIVDSAGRHGLPLAGKHVKSTKGDVTIEYHCGLPQITVPLPSRKERCVFTLKPITNTVGDFLAMLRHEDKGIDRAVCKTCDGTRIAASNTIETLLSDEFILIVNDNVYRVDPPMKGRMTGEEVQRLNDVKTIVNQLYEALHVHEHQLSKEKELATQLEALQQELLPLEEKKNQLELVASKKTNWLAWAGLGLMSVQFGILARLTWWEYSWDIMEPVTYFVTYGTAMAAYAYFVLTRQEYILADVKDRQYLLTVHKKAKKLGLDLNQYNQLREQMAKLDKDLRKLRNPLRLQLPPKPKIPGAEQVPETQTAEIQKEATIKPPTLGTISEVINNSKSNNLFVNKPIKAQETIAKTTTDEKVAKLKETPKDTATK